MIRPTALLAAVLLPASGLAFTSEGTITDVEGVLLAEDVDQDGDLDLLISQDDGVHILLDEGSAFATTPIVVPTTDEVRGMAVGDLDGDGDMDIALSTVAGVAWAEKNGDTYTVTFLEDIGATPQGIQIADLDNDGDGDLVTGNWNTNDCLWLQNDGTGSFAASSAIGSANSVRGVNVADVNGDGIDDAVFHGAHAGVFVAFGGDGAVASTSRFNAGGYTDTVSLQDLDGDGATDVLVSNTDGGGFYRLMGNGADFDTVETLAGESALYPFAADLDADGVAEMIAVSSTDDDIVAFVDDGAGGFNREVVLDLDEHIYRAIAVDIDDDGDEDLLVASNAGVELFRNDLFDHDVLELTSSSVTPGDDMTLTLSNAPDGMTAWFLAGLTTSEDASCDPVYGVCADIENFVVLGSATVVDGEASFTRTAPILLPVGETANFQAVWVDGLGGEAGVSEVVSQTILADD
jgi:hypothetical protein